MECETNMEHVGCIRHVKRTDNTRLTKVFIDFNLFQEIKRGKAGKNTEGGCQQGIGNV